MNSFEKKLAEIKLVPLFEGFSDDLLKSLLNGSSFKNFKHRELLYQAGLPIDTFSIVTQGAFKLVKPTFRGDDVIVYFATPGDAIGAVLMNKAHVVNYPVTAQAMGPSQALCVPRNTYLQSWSDNIEIQKRINSMLFARMSLLQEDKASNKLPLTQKISNVLMGLIDRNQSEDVQKIPIPLTRQEIADSLGVTVESVIRVMSQWDQQGIIRTHEQRIEIIKLDQIIGFLKQS
ncbi:MAG: Crp/Fnr family transcriptional regulator [Pseudobdellovibrio sp.]